MKKLFASLLIAVLFFGAFSASACASGLQTDTVSGDVGDSFTVSYVIPNRVENVGSISLYINYDNSVLQASVISPNKPALLNQRSSISCVASEETSSGSIIGSWIEAYCSMVLEPGASLLDVTFTFIGETQGTQITSDLKLNGMASADSYGGDNLTALAGVNNAPLTISTNNYGSQNEVKEPEDVVVPGNETFISPTPILQGAGQATESKETTANIESATKEDAEPAKLPTNGGVIASFPPVENEVAKEEIAEIAEIQEQAKQKIEPSAETSIDLVMNVLKMTSYILCAVAVVVILACIIVVSRKRKR